MIDLHTECRAVIPGSAIFDFVIVIEDAQQICCQISCVNSRMSCSALGMRLISRPISIHFFICDYCSEIAL